MADSPARTWWRMALIDSLARTFASVTLTFALWLALLVVLAVLGVDVFAVWGWTVASVLPVPWLIERWFPPSWAQQNWPPPHA